MDRLMEFIEKYLGGFFDWWKDKTHLPTVQYGRNFSVSWSGVVFWLILILCMVLFLPACSTTPKPYLEVGIGYNIDGMTDHWLQTGRTWTCNNNDTFHAELGVEFDHNLTLGYHHQSHLSCGGPFNNHPEVYQDELILTKKWGGK